MGTEVDRLGSFRGPQSAETVQAWLLYVAVSAAHPSRSMILKSTTTWALQLSLTRPLAAGSEKWSIITDGCTQVENWAQVVRCCLAGDAQLLRSLQLLNLVVMPVLEWQLSRSVIPSPYEPASQLSCSSKPEYIALLFVA